MPWWVKLLTSVLQTVQQNKTTIYIWTVHIYRLYRRQCARYTYTYTQYTQCTIKTYFVTNAPIHIIHRIYTSALCPQQYVKVQQIIIYSRFVVQQIVVQRCNRLYICNVMGVLLWCPVKMPVFCSVYECSNNSSCFNGFFGLNLLLQHKAGF